MRNVRVIQGCANLGLALEAGEPLAVMRDVAGKHLERDIALQPRITRDKRRPCRLHQVSR
jgi:hypothetical protein